MARRKTIAKAIAVTLGVLLGLPVLVLLGAYALVQSEGGRDWVAGRILEAVEEPGVLEVSVEALEGDWPRRIGLRGLTLADGQGPWLQADRVLVEWRPLELLSGRLAVAKLETAGLALERLPAGASSQAEEEEGSPIPQLPFAVTVEELRGRDIRLGAAVAGEAATFDLQGGAKADEAGVLTTSLVVTRTDGPREEVALEALFRPAEDHLGLHLAFSTPQGGTVGRLLQVADLPDTRLELSGEGPLSAWRGRLTGSVEGRGRVEAELAAARQEGLRFSIVGTVSDLAGLPQELEALLAGSSTFALEAAWSEPGELTLSGGRLETPTVSAELEGRLDLDEEQLEARALVLSRDDAVLARLLQLEALEGARLELEATGPLAAPALRVAVEAGRVVTPEASVTEAKAVLDLAGRNTTDPEAFDGTVSASGSLESLSLAAAPEAQPFLEGPLTWALEGRLDLSRAAAQLERFSLQGAIARLAGSGSLDLDAGAADLTVEAGLDDLSPAEAFLGRKLRGGIALAGPVAVQAFGESVSAQLEGKTQALFVGEPAIQALLGPEADIAIDAAYGAEGVNLKSLRFEGPNSLLSGKAALSPDFADLAADYALSLAEARPLGDALGLALRGGAQVDGTLAGDPANPAVAGSLRLGQLGLEEITLTDLTADFDLQGVAVAPSGEIEVAAASPFGLVSAKSRVRLKDKVLALEDLRLESSGTLVTGRVHVPLEGTPVDADLRVQAPEIADWLAIAELAGGGAAEGRIRLSAADGRQALQADLEAKGLVLETGPESIGIDSVSAKLESRDLLGSGEGRLGLSARGLRRAALAIDELDLEGEGSADDLGFRLRAEGAWQEPFSLQSEGRVAIEGSETSLQLARAEGRFLETPIRLSQPLRLVHGEGRLVVEDLELEAGPGQLAGSFRFGPGEVAGKVTATTLPLEPLQLFLPLGKIAGRATGTAELSGSKEAPAGQAELVVADLTLGAVPSADPLRLALSGTWREGRLRVLGGLAGASERDATLDAELPLRLEAAGGLVVPETEPLRADLSWEGDAAEVWPLVPLPEHRVAGRSALAVKLSGSLSAPRMNGSLTLTGGEYESLEYGTFLKDVKLEVGFDDRRVEIASLTAGDGEAGRLEAEGRLEVAPEAGFPFRLQGELEKFVVLRRDEVAAATSGSFAVSGAQDRAEVSGRFVTDGVEVRILDALPPEVAALEVTELDSAETGLPRKISGPQGEAGFGGTLDVEVEMPRRVFVRGRGLDSEWQGKVAAVGDLLAPGVSGRLELVRGQVSLVGKTFELTRGELLLPEGEQAEPVIDVAAERRLDDLTVTVQVRGPATSPEILLTSNPEIPQDEIVSRVLFGKSTAQLSSLEAVQLAAAVAELSGKGGGAFGVLDLARGTVGLDVLSVETVGEGEDAKTAVSVGKYVTEDVYVGVKKGATAGAESTSVEVQLTPNISVESGVGEQGENKAGVRFKFDY